MITIFQKTNCKCQVVSLGAGFDTTFWNLKDKDMCAERYIELDFKDVTSRKSHYIKSRKELHEHLISKGINMCCINIQASIVSTCNF